MTGTSEAAIVTEEGPGRNPVAVWAVVFVGLLLCRLWLPMRPTDTSLVHEAIVDSLVAGHNWGRQALVGSLEYPPLPTLALLLARCLVGARFAVRFLVALSQAWALCYLLRLRQGAWRRLAFATLAGIFVLALPDVRAALGAGDVNWLTAVPFCAALYHLQRWFRGRWLRDAVLTAVNGGLLALCGLCGVAAALGLLLILVRDVHHPARGVETGDVRGVGLLVWAPFVYCLGLWFLWNWLILGDAWFCARTFWVAMQGLPVLSLPLRTARVLAAGPVAFWAGALLLAAAVRRTDWRPGQAVLACGAAVVFSRAVALTLSLFPGGGTPLLACGALSALAMLPSRGASGSAVAAPRWLRPVLLSAACLLLAYDMTLAPPADPVAEGAFRMGAPAAETVTELIDRHWPRSRTAVYGIRLPALYHDPLEDRFVARVDYHEDIFVAQARDEVMHLLVPPPDQRFYLSPGSVFGEIYRHGRPHLILEQEWATGWQLWRCVIFPRNESDLRGLE